MAADMWVQEEVAKNKNEQKTSHEHPVEANHNKDSESRKDPITQSQSKNSESNKHLRADKRAEWLLDHLKIERPTTYDANLDHVISECHMYLDKITQWCSTVGLFLSNITHILESPSLVDVAPHDNEKEEKMNLKGADNSELLLPTFVLVGVPYFPNST